MKIIIALNALIEGERAWDDKFDHDPNSPLIQIVRTLAEEYQIFCYTTIPEQNRLEIEGWLIDYDVPVDELLMRQDYSKNYECSIALINSVDNVQCLIDSDIRIVETMKNEFLTLEV